MDTEDRKRRREWFTENRRINAHSGHEELSRDGAVIDEQLASIANSNSIPHVERCRVGDFQVVLAVVMGLGKTCVAKEG